MAEKTVRTADISQVPPVAEDHVTPQLALDREEIAAFCRRHQIRRLALFGSAVRDDFGPASDVDVLVEFEPNHVPGLAFFAMQDELSALIGRPVDLNTLESLSPYIRDAVQREAHILHDAT